MLDRLLTTRNAILIVTLAAVAVLGAAHIFQYGFGYEPCELCLYQRLPWWIVAGIGCAAYWCKERYPGLSVMLCLLAGITLLAGAGLAGYHAGVEWKWWPGPSGCTAQEVDFENLQDLKAAIMAAPNVRCDEIPWSLFGISMAGYNFLISLAVGALAVAAPLRRR